MDHAKVGSVFRAVRIRRGMSQSQVAEAAGISRAVVSIIERGLLDDTSLRMIGRVSAALGISCELEARWRGAETATLLDERHARLVQLGGDEVDQARVAGPPGAHVQHLGRARID